MVGAEPHGDSPSSDPVEDWIAELLTAEDDTRTARLLELCARHPEHADTLRRRMALLNQVGLASGPPKPEFPEKLGEFTLLRRIGGGGMGVVYAARQQGLSRTVALKLIRPEHLYFERSRERFRREVEAVARLQHPAIVPIYTVGESDGIPYFAMELVSGCSVADALHALGERDPQALAGKDLAAAVAPEHASAPLWAGSWPDTCLRIARAVAEALVHAHERGVLHRDVKPSNVMLTADGRVLLMDFGLALADDTTPLTRTGAMLGSLPYMPPEQVRGSRHLDARADVYSLGVMLYELLTLRMPFGGDDSESQRARILAGDKEPVEALNPRVPQDARLVCTTALDPDPRRRYATMRLFLQDLDNVLARRRIAARRPGLALRAKRWVERNRIVAAITATAVLGSAGIAVQQWLLRASIEEQRAVAVAEARTSRRVTEYLARLFDELDPAKTQGQAPTARLILDKSARRVRDELADEPAVRGALLNALGDVYWSLGLVAEAAPVLEEALALRRRHAGARDVALTLHLLARLAALRGEHDLALHRLEEAKALVRGLEPGDDSLDVTVRHSEGQLMHERGDLDGSARVLDELLARLRAQGTRDARLLHCLVSRGSVAKDSGDRELGLRLLLEAKDLCAVLHSEMHPDELPVLWTLGSLWIDVGKLGEADVLFARAHEITRKLYADDPYNLALAYDQIAKLATARGDTALAEKRYAEAIATLEKSGSGEQPHCLVLLNHYGTLLMQLGRGDEAEPLLRRVLRVREERGIADQPGLAFDQLALAQLLTMRNEVDEARKLFRKAMPVIESKFGRQHSAWAAALHSWAIFQATSGDTKAAERDLRAAITIRKALSAASDPELGTALDNLGYMLAELGRDADAEPVLAEAIVELRKSGGGSRLGATVARHAKTLAAVGRREDAEKELLAAAGEAKSGSPEALAFEKALVELYEAWGRPEAAAKHREK